MKDKIPLRKTKLEYYKFEGAWKSLRRSAKQHGYRGFLSFPRFIMTMLMDQLLHFISYFIPLPGIRIKFQRMRGVKIGKRVQIGPQVTIDLVFPNFVIIEDGVSIAGKNYILSHNTPLEYHKNDFNSFVAPVIIKKNAWIAIGAIILPGVTIGEGSVIAAGSIVTKDVPDHTIAAGTPAKVIRELSHATLDKKLNQG